MGGGVVHASTARVRIKGRKLSVIRFLIMSIAYTIPWIIMLSQLAYYSKIYGPQVLLQLNIAYYLPSIPILLLAGHIEKMLDEHFGTTASMAIRITIGLTGCATIAAAYPFIPPRLSYLLWVVVALGSISAVAFSTSYQLVAWFRSADTIALGIGCVASGPLALIIQIALQIGTTPKRWQWIGLFEAAAGLVLVGLLAAWSLFVQYWDILSGKEVYCDTTTPLLEDTAEQESADNEAGEQALLLSRMLTMQDPFQGFPFTTTPGMALPHLRPLLRRAASDDLSGVRRASRRTQHSTAHAMLGRHGHGQVSRSRTAGTLLVRTSKNAAAAAAAAAGGPGGLGDGGCFPNLSNLSGTSSNRQLTQQWLLQQVQQQGVGTPTYSAAAAAAAAGNAAAWFDLENQQQLPGYFNPNLAGSLASSIHSISRPSSPAPIPAAGAGRSASFIEDIPAGFPADILQQHGQRNLMATSAPTTTTASLFGDEEENEEAVAALAAANTFAAAAAAAMAAAEAAAAAAGGDGSELPSDDSSGGHRDGRRSPVVGRRRFPAAAAAAPAAPAASGLLGMEHSLQVWVNPAAAPSAVSGEAATASTPRGPVSPAARAAAASNGAAGAVLPDLSMPSHPPSSSSSSLFSQQQQQGQQAAAKPPLPAGQQPQQQQQVPLQQQYRHLRTASGASAVSGASASAFSNAASVAGSDVAVGTAGSDIVSVRDDGEAEGLGAVYWEVFKYTWMVVLAALISSTLLNCIFPFFTYVESSGLLGEFLPQVLFYTRMLSDILGRLLPRKKALAITAPAALLALSGTLLLCSAVFFVYLQVPPRMQYDPYVMALVLILWLGGGYINTMSYILAPSLVPARICTKASALMALTYQVAHIVGLVLATALALGLYGDISGSL